MVKKKLRLQTLIFDRRTFRNRIAVKKWVAQEGYSVDKRLKAPIMKCDNGFRVRQRNADWFNKKTFKERNLGKGIKGVFGYLKNK